MYINVICGIRLEPRKYIINVFIFIANYRANYLSKYKKKNLEHILIQIVKKLVLCYGENRNLVYLL